jgi:hypothetical protein
MKKLCASAGLALLLGTAPSLPAVADDGLDFVCTPASLVDSNGDGVVELNERVAANMAGQPEWTFDPNGDGHTAADEFVCAGAPFAEEMSPAAGDVSAVARNKAAVDQGIARENPSGPLPLDINRDGAITFDEWPLTTIW